jgi:hypothetical protein
MQEGHMAAEQGSVELLQDPVAQELLSGPYPAHLAYVWKDGTARVVPIAFHWNGKEIVMAGVDSAPKNDVIDGQKVTLVIDSYSFPFKVLTIRGTARLEKVAESPEEYAIGNQKLMGDEGIKNWLAGLGPLMPKIKYFGKITLTPEWVRVTDFQTRFPEEMERVFQRP